MSGELGEDAAVGKFPANGIRQVNDPRKPSEEILKLQTGGAAAQRPNPLTPMRRPANVKGPADGDLLVCAGVKLKGAIGSCNILTVEGEVEGRVQARQLVVAGSGSFSGTAHVEQADIAGRFTGNLEVPGKLVVRGSGRLDCQVSYGQLEIESGGEMSGQIARLSDGRPSIFSTWVQRTARAWGI